LKVAALPASVSDKTNTKMIVAIGAVVAVGAVAFLLMRKR
jgi:hypothetical protein